MAKQALFLLTKQSGLALIRFYQRFISPHKGFSCAYRVYTGHSSCSSLGYRAVRKYGLLAGVALIQERTHLCGVAYRRYSQPNPRLEQQKGECDVVGCDTPAACDAPCDMNHPILKNSCQVADACSCDFSSTRSKNSEKEQYVYIPPNIKF